MKLRSFCVFLLIGEVFADDLLVSIQQGTLRGHRLLSRNKKEFLAFQGIPYGKPPIGELRFKKSLPAGNWDGVRDATKEGADCTQKDIHIKDVDETGKEDCLFVNVYTPKIKTNSLFPVMFWIYGGGWLAGSGSSLYYGGEFLVDKDVVLVTFNYRVGAFGFLSTSDDVCPGNNGLKDQVLALHWVKDNIAQFGGDPDRVTLFGESAGGGSVHLHTISPLSRGLFHGAIAMSGTALGSWALAPAEVALGLTKRLSAHLNCTIETSDKMIQCLRQKDVGEIMKSTALFAEWSNHPLVIFRPVQEAGPDAFLPDDPIVLLQNSDSVANVPFMTGITSGDGGIGVASLLSTPPLMQEYSDNFEKLAPLTLLYRETSPDPDDVTRRIKEFYFKDKPISDSHQAVLDMWTDSFFALSADNSVRMQRAAITAPVFYYYIDYMPPVSFLELYGGPSDGDYGVGHGDDLLFLFPNKYMFPGLDLSSENDTKMTETFLTMWTDFAKTGNPTPTGSQQVHWNPVESSEVEYLHIGRDGQVNMRNNLLAKRMQFWATLPLTNHRFTSIRDEL